MTKWVLMAALAAGGVSDYKFNTLTVPSFTELIQLEAGSANLGPTAPTWSATAAANAFGLAFDADAESVSFSVEIPPCWDAASDMLFEIYWTNEPGVAIANTETVKWDISYRSINVDASESITNGTIATATATYTQSGAGSDGDSHESEITIDYDGANQPLAIGDLLMIQADRDMTGDTYAGDAVVVEWHIHFTADTFCNSENG